MIARALIVAACAIPHVAFAQDIPRTAVEFQRLPALGRLVESGMEKDYRFRTYLANKRPSAQGEVTIFIGDIHMRLQDISTGAPRRPVIRKYRYAARCTGADNTLGVNTQSIAPPEKAQMYISVSPGVELDAVDRTWYNVWYAVCRGESINTRAIRSEGRRG
jgi:hypothetical protein